MSYTANTPKYGIANVCPDPEMYYSNAQLLAKFPNGIGSESLTPDPATGRVPSGKIQGYLLSIESAGVLKPRPSQKIGSGESARRETDMDKLVAIDAALANQLRVEYCYYEQRYRYALTQFLAKATSGNQADNEPAEQMLDIAKVLNLRLNSVLEIMSHMAQERVTLVNDNKNDINITNKSINSKLGKLKQSYSFLSRDDAIVRTQKEMVRFTEEKNNYTSNQIAVWATLNIIAIGSIVYVYRN